MVMAHPYYHAVSSARKFGGQPEDYLPIHNWFDASKAFAADFRHRVLRHHAEGIFECERQFGTTIMNSAGQKIPVRQIGEQHVKEDFNGKIPSLQDWIETIQPARWMMKSQKLSCTPVGESQANADPNSSRLQDFEQANPQP